MIERIYARMVSVPERILVFFFLLRKYYGSRMDIFERPLSRREMSGLWIENKTLPFAYKM